MKDKPQTKNPGHIKNKLKRAEMYGKYLLQKRQLKRETRIQRSKEAAELGDDIPVQKKIPKTLDNTRDFEVTTVRPDDEEVLGDESCDEFVDYFSDTVRPKIIVTTRPRPSSNLFHFISDLMRFFPRLFYYPRKSFSVKEIIDFARKKDKGFTHLMVLSEKSKVCNGMIISHIRETDAVGGNQAGPTAFFKISNVIPSTDVPNHGTSTTHVPELVLNGFTTRLGHRCGRFLGSLFPHNAQFQGRQVATFHNQRDYIFVRHHRYIFAEGEEELVCDKEKAKKRKKTKARLQELGPRFTMKLRWIQNGTFDTQFGEYEWIHKRKEMDLTRRKFHL